MTEPAAANATPPSALRLAARGLLSVLVLAFVGWHLFFLVVRNFVGSLGPEGAPRIAARVEGLLAGYAAKLGIEQGWRIFSPPTARQVPLPAVRLHFDEGSATVLSDDEPAEVTGWFRLGGTPQRRLEEFLVAAAQVGGVQRSVLEPAIVAWVRGRIARYRADHPDERRRILRVELLLRTRALPAPGDPPDALGPVRETVALELARRPL